jgi:hypothetical protein
MKALSPTGIDDAHQDVTLDPAHGRAAPARLIQQQGATVRYHMRNTLGLVCVALTIVVPVSVNAQGTARSLDLEPSVRAAGAGSAGSAVFWGGDPNYWANPALLGYHRGLRYEWGKTQLVPGLATDVFFKTERYTIGIAGIGVALAGKPHGLGGLRLDYGATQGTDEQGNPTEIFDAYEDIQSLGIGVSLAELGAAIARHAGSDAPALARHVDIAVGMNRKHVKVVLAPGFEGETDASDIGFLFRVSPVNTFGAGGYRRSTTLPVRFDLSYGWSILNYDDAMITYPTQQPFPTSRIFKNGLAAQVAVGFPRSARRNMEHRWLADALDPLVSVGTSAELEHVQAGDRPSPSYDVRRYGVEVTVANILSLRTGYVDDQEGEIQNATFGLGLGFNFGRIAGFRYDWAQVPQSTGLEDVKRNAFTVFFDPIGYARYASEGSERGRSSASLE